MIEKYELPNKFEELSEARQQGFVDILELKREGKLIAGTFCAYTPKEILDAAGFVTVGLCGTKQETIPDAEMVLPKNLCPLIKSSYGFALTEKCPYFYFSDVIIGETTCDGKKKMYELLEDLGKNVHIMHLPQGKDRPHSIKVWKEEMKILIEFLEEKFNVEITEEKIRKAIIENNKQRKKRVEMFELQKLVPPPMRGVDMIRSAEGDNYKFIAEERIETIDELLSYIKTNYKVNGSPVSIDAKRIMVTGCPLGGVVDKVCQTIEDNGGVIVVYDTCAGTRASKGMVDEKAEDIFEALAKRYLGIGCSVLTNNTDRLDNLESLIDEYQVEGVIEVVLQACHTFNIEAVKVKRIIQGKAVPYMKLEVDYSESDMGQLSTRIQAFIELL